MARKSADAFRTISEVADWLDVAPHVLRFWESKFTPVKPVKRAGGRRYYRPQDMLLLGGIKKLLHDDGLTIKGVQKVLREDGVGHVSALSIPVDGQIPAPEKASAPQAMSDPAPQSAPEPTNELPAFLTRKPAETPDTAEEPEAAPLPSFLQPSAEPAPIQTTAPDASADPDPDAPPQPRARVVDAPDPDEATFTPAPAILSTAFSATTLTPDQRAAIAPLAGRLAALRDRMAAER